ncbi:unnamed protein product, partial [Hymenolepis diminuta]
PRFLSLPIYLPSNAIEDYEYFGEVHAWSYYEEPSNRGSRSSYYSEGNEDYFEEQSYEIDDSIPGGYGNDNPNYYPYNQYYAHPSPSSGSGGGGYLPGNKMHYYEGAGANASSGEAFSREGSDSSSSGSSASDAEPYRMNYRHHHGDYSAAVCDFVAPTDDPEALQIAASLSPNQKSILAHVMQALGPKTVWDGLMAGKKRQQMQKAAAASSESKTENGEEEKEGCSSSSNGGEEKNGETCNGHTSDDGNQVNNISMSNGNHKSEIVAPATTTTS